MPSEKILRPEKRQDPITILVVDDEPEYLDLIRLFLEDEQKFLVDTCSSAREALVDLKTQKYDIIISDYTMPWMDGIIFLKTLRTQGDHTPFILTSTKGREDVAIEALNAGAEYYIVKDGRAGQFFSSLIGKIEEIVRRRESREGEELVAFIESFPVGLVRITHSGEVLVWNRAFSMILDLGREDKVGKLKIQDFFADDKDWVFLSALIEKEGRIDDVLVPMLTRNQRNIWVRMRGKGARDVEGTLLYLDIVVEEQPGPPQDAKEKGENKIRTLEKSG